MTRRAKYIRTAIEGILGSLGEAAKGGRNVALNTAALGMGRFVATGDVDRTGAEGVLFRWAVEAGLSKNEADKTIKRGLDAGLSHPAQMPDFGQDGPARRLSSFRHPPTPQPVSDIPAPPAHLHERLRAVFAAMCEASAKSDARREWAESRGLKAAFLGDKWRPGAGWEVPAGWAAEHIGDHEDFVEMGWRKADGKHWTGATEPGLLIPLFSRAFVGVPVAWRWMPWPGTWPAATQKRWAMPGGDLWRKVPMWRPTAIPSDTLVIVEGEPDYWSLEPSLHAMGADCLGLPGAQWATHWDGLLRGRRRVIVATHGDEAGDGAAARIGQAATGAIVTRARPAGGDWNDAICRGEDRERLACEIIGLEFR